MFLSVFPVFSPSFLLWVSSVFLIPPQCSLSPPPLLSEKVGETMAGGVGWSDRVLGGGRQSPRALLAPPAYLSASYIPNDRFICFKRTVDPEVEFLEWSHAHSGSPTADLHIMSLTLHPISTQQPGANFCFQDNHSISPLWLGHQEYCWWYEELKVLFFVSLVRDIGDDKTVMIENWFLMHCLETVHAGIGTQNNLNVIFRGFFSLFSLFNFTLHTFYFFKDKKIQLFCMTPSAITWGVYWFEPSLYFPSLLGAAAAACCANTSVIHQVSYFMLPIFRSCFH